MSRMIQHDIYNLKNCRVGASDHQWKLIFLKCVSKMKSFSTATAVAATAAATATTTTKTTNFIQTTIIIKIEM